MTRPSRLMTLFAVTFVALLGIGPLKQGRIGIGRAEAAGGCGLGFHRGPYGGCRPNGYGGYYGRPGYGYRGGAVYGYRGGAYGYRGRASTVVAPFTAVGVAASTAAVHSMEEVVSAAKHKGSILLCNRLSCFRLLAISER